VVGRSRLKYAYMDSHKDYGFGKLHAHLGVPETHWPEVLGRVSAARRVGSSRGAPRRLPVRPPPLELLPTCPDTIITAVTAHAC
jgi:hypothetical protein